MYFLNNTYLNYINALPRLNEAATILGHETSYTQAHNVLHNVRRSH